MMFHDDAHRCRHCENGTSVCIIRPSASAACRSLNSGSMLSVQAPLALLLWRGPEDLSIPAPKLGPFRHPDPSVTGAKAALEASPAEGRPAGTGAANGGEYSNDAAVQRVTDLFQPPTGMISLVTIGSGFD